MNVTEAEELQMRLLNAGLTGADLQLVVTTLRERRDHHAKSRTFWQKYARDLAGEPDRQQLYEDMADDDTDAVEKLDALLTKLGVERW